MSEKLTRREALIKVGYLAGGTLSAGTIASLMASCAKSEDPGPEAAAEPGWQPQVVSREQASILEGLVDGILPATDTPGAVDAGVPAFFDLMLKDYFTENARSVVIAGLDSVDAACVEAHGSPWNRLNAEQKIQMVEQLDQEAYTRRQEGGDPHYFGIIKEMTLWGYFFSEAGASQLHRFEISPGPFEGCIDLAEVGKPWTFFVSPPDLDDYFI